MKTGQIFMIVDDDEDDIDFFRDAIFKIDPAHTCMTASNGEDALNKLHKETGKLPDFIFLDLNMPRMDGKTCLKELKKQERLRDIPIIIYTTSAYQKERDEILKLGAAHFLTKAYSIKTLQEGIRNIIENLGG